MGNDSKTVFCPSCQIEVEAILSPYGASGSLVPRCTLCGSVIDESISDIGDSCDMDPSVSLDEISMVDQSISVPALDQVLVVGFPPSVRELLLDKMTEKNLAREIYPCQNGEEMIHRVIESLKNGGHSQVDLVVTDVPMPFLNGINAAIGLRAIEKTYPEHDLIPVLFLTNKACDDTFKKVIKYLAPAKYATLGPVDDKTALVKHLLKIIGLVAREKW